GADRGKAVGAAQGIPGAQPGRNAAGAAGGGRRAGGRRGGDCRIRRRDARRVQARQAAVCRRFVRARRNPAADRLVSRQGGIIRAARANIRQHLKYTNWLAGTRNWLAGPRLTYADMAAAAMLSVLDYLGEIDWSEHHAAREWYQRMKSRPSFRPLLQDRVRG